MKYEKRRGSKRKKISLNKLVASEALEGLVNRVTSASKAEEEMEKYEDAHPELVKFFDKQTQFFWSN